MASALTEPAKLLLLTALLANDKIVSKNGISFIKELILRRDPRLTPLLKAFESKDDKDNTFVEQIHELIMEESQIVYDELFEDTSLEVGKTLSKDEREKKHLNAEKSLIYGEVEYNSFYRVLRKINPQAGLIFYDLGSGTGKAVFVARLTQDFSKCIGIEILEGLHTEAESIVKKYNEDFKHLLYHGQTNYANVFEGSFLDFDWSDGDVVFANSTCFDDELMLGLSKAAEKIKPGAIVVTFTKGMTSRKFEVLEKKRYKMSWGPATVFIHRRLNANGTPVGPNKLNLLPSDQDDYDNDESQSPSKQVYKGSSSDYRNVKGSDSEEEEEEEEEETSDYENGGIDEGDEEEEDEDDETEERHYKHFNHDEGKYQSEEDEEEEEEDDDDDDVDIDEYIRNITREMRQKDNSVSAANAAYAAASAVHSTATTSSFSPKQGGGAQQHQYHESSPSRDKAYDEEESATEGSESDNGTEEDSNEGEEGDDGEEDNDDEDEDDDEDDDNFRDVDSPNGEEDEEEDDDEEEVNEEVRHEMEEQIRLISARIAHNKSLIHTYTNMASQYTHKDPSHSPGNRASTEESEEEDEEDSDGSSGSELQPVHTSPAKTSSPYKTTTASPGNRQLNYPPTPPSASALRAAGAVSSGSGSKSSTPHSGTKGASPSPGNPYASPVRSVNGSNSAPGSYTSPTKASSGQKDPSPYANAPPQLSSAGLSSSGKKLFVSSSPSQRSSSSAADFAQMTSPQDSALQARKRMGQLAGRKLNPTDSD